MRTVLLASLRTHTRRYGAAVLAIVIGVVFILVTAALSSAVRSGLTAGIAEPYDGADAVLDKPTADDAAAVLAAADDAGADAWLIGWSIQPVEHDGTTIDDRADIGQVPDDPTRRWQQLVSGRFPDAPGEVVVDKNTARADHVAVGDRIRIGSGTRALDAEVVGVVDSPSTFAAASAYLLMCDLARWQDDLYVSSVAWAGTGGFDDAADALRSVVPHSEPLTVDTFVQQLQTEANNQVDVIAIIVLLFAAISLFVSVLVINNTFTILFAQRSRTFALLRCVGATRRQVLRSIRAESLTLGVLAAALGVALGVLAGHGLVHLIRAQWPEARLGTADIGAGWMLAAAGTAVTVTLVAAWLPTRRAVRVRPLAALRPDDSTRPTNRTGLLRIGLGLAAIVMGSVALAVAISTAVLPALVVGGAAVFTGVVLLGPVVVPTLIRVAGRAGARVLGPSGRLAAGNAVRNPRRTAATTASLLIGVTLTTAVLTGMASSRSAIDAEMDVDHPIDVALTSSETLTTDALRRIRSADGVGSMIALPGTTAQIAGRDLPVLSMSDDVVHVAHGRLDRPRPGEILVSWDLLDDDVSDGDLVTVRVGARTERLRVIGADGFGEAALVRRTTLERLAPRADVRAVWIRAGDGADADDLAGTLGAIVRDADIENGLARRAYVDLQLDVVTGGVLGLLAIAVVIALVGVSNTLGLSVLERGREHALLRAIGLTRRQVRRMLATEAVLLTTVATLIGTTLGVVFAWAGVQTLVAPAVAGAGLVLPWPSLALVALTAAVAGLAAAVLPSRRAARISPVEGLALD